MVQRTVQFNMDFNVENLNTIGQLEEELAAINKQLEYVDVNSDSFKELSKQAQAVDGKLRSVNESLEGVTGTERVEGVRRLSEGLVGGFAAAASASVLFGDKTSEAMEKAIQKAGALFIAADGIQKVFLALEKSNVKALKSVVLGFGKSAKAALAFAATTRGALISTGIGALLVGVGLLIANFGKLRAAVKKNADKMKKALLVLSPPLYLVIKAIERIKEAVGDLQNLFAGLGAFIKKIFTIDGTGLEGAKEAFKETVELEKELDEIRGEYNEKIEETTEAYENQLEILKEQGVEQEVINEYIRDRLELEQELLERKAKLGKITDEERERLREIDHQLKLQSIRETKLAQQRVVESQKAADEAEKLALAAQAKAKADSEAAETARANLVIAQEEAKNARESYDAALQRTTLQQELIESDRIKLSLDNDILNNQERNLEIFNVILENNEELARLKALEKEITEDLTLTDKERADRLSKVEEATIKYYNNVRAEISTVINDLNEDEKLQLRILGIREDQLNAEIRIAKRSQQNIEAKRKEAKEAASILYAEAELLDAGKERDELLEQANAKQAEYFGYMEQETEAMTTIIQLERDKRDLLKEENQLIGEAARARNEPIEIEETLWQTRQRNLDDWLAKNQIYIDATIAAGYAVADIFQTIADNRLIDLEEWREANLEALEEIQDAEADHDDERQELNELLKDAEGERYDAILAQLAALDAKEAETAKKRQEFEKQEAKMFNEAEQAKYNAAVAEKATNVVQSLIATALAVVKALPNIPLSIVVGALGAVGTGIIAGQKIPKPKKYTPSFAEGGEIIGSSHATGGVPINAEGGEYVINKSATRAFLPILDSINAAGKAFANGGEVLGQEAPATPAAASELIDYERMADAIAMRPQFVSVVEFNDVANRLKVVEARSSI